jgi:hypothetical protein
MAECSRGPQVSSSKVPKWRLRTHQRVISLGAGARFHRSALQGWGCGVGGRLQDQRSLGAESLTGYGRARHLPAGREGGARFERRRRLVEMRTGAVHRGEAQHRRCHRARDVRLGDPGRRSTRTGSSRRNCPTERQPARCRLRHPEVRATEDPAHRKVTLGGARRCLAALGDSCRHVIVGRLT